MGNVWISFREAAIAAELMGDSLEHNKEKRNNNNGYTLGVLV